MMIRGLCFVGAGLFLVGAAIGGCSSDSGGGTTSSSGTSGTSSSGTSGTSGTSSGTSGTSSGTSGTSSGTSGTSSGTSGTSSGTSGTSGTSGDAGQDSGATPTCAVYCAAIKANCTGATNTQYITDADCTTACAALPVGLGSDNGGQDTLGCRIYHANAAAGSAANATTHCPHASAWGSTVCDVSAADKECTTYCEVDIAACGSGANKPFPDAATCKTACMGWARSADRVNAAQPTAGDTYDCRAWHLLKAMDGVGTDLATHCPHTADVSAVCHQ